MTVIRNSISRFQDMYLQQLSILVGIVKQHIRAYVPDIFVLIEELWPSTTLHVAIVCLVESLGTALDTEFRPFLPTALPAILRVFDGELNDKRQVAQIHALRAFVSFGNNIEEYLHLVIPVMVKACEGPGASIVLRKTAVQTIDGLSRRLNFSDHVSRIVHPLVRTLAVNVVELRSAIMDTLCALVFQLGSEFTIFVPMIDKVWHLLSIYRMGLTKMVQCLLRHRIQHEKYQELISKLRAGERLPQEFGQIEYDLLLLEDCTLPTDHFP